MRSLNLVLLSLGTFAAGFRFTGVPSSATAGQSTSATLIRDNSDPTAFSLLLRLNSQQGGTTIQTFQSEQLTSIPFSFTPTEAGSFIIEVISDLEPISATEKPANIYASSSSITVAVDDKVSVPPPPTPITSSENVSSPQNTNTATTSFSATAATTTNNVQSSFPIEDPSIGNPSGTLTSATRDSSVVTTSPSISTSGVSVDGNLGHSSQTAASNPGSSITTGSFISSTFTSPGETASSAPSSAASKDSNTGMIVGLVFGVLAFIAICLALLLAYTRYRRRKRTTGFQRHLMVRQFGSSPLVFERMTPSFSTSEDGEGYREYDNADILEPGLVTQSEISHPPSIYSEPSVQSIHSDSPSIFYTAVPRAGAPGEPALPPSIFSNLSSALGLTLGPPVSESFAPAPAPPPLPQLAPGWVFPRAPVRTSQLPPPKTSRQMEIYDRKVRLQGKLITMQGWGNTTASDSQKAEMMVLKEQIRRLEVLENSPWAMGTSDQLPDLT